MSYEFHRCLPWDLCLNFSSGMRSRLGLRSLPRLDTPESDPPQSDSKKTSSDLHRVGGYGCSCGDPDHLTNGTGAPSKEPHRDLCMICGRITLSSGPRRFLP